MRYNKPMKKLKVTCLKCNQSDVHSFEGQTLVCSDKVIRTPLLGVRFRADGKFGYRCVCGNNNLFCKQEEKDLEKFVPDNHINWQVIKESFGFADDEQFKVENC